jgi:hypothetical protein
MTGAGGWGEEQHPTIHRLVSTDLFRAFYYPWTTKFLPFIFVAMYVALFFQKRVKKMEVACGAILYILTIGTFWGFVFAVSGLASQGAGH